MKRITAVITAVLLFATICATPALTGCNGTTVAQDIVNWTPALQSAVATIDSSMDMLLPTDAAIFAASTAGFDAGSDMVVTLAKSYLANPNATVLAQLQAAIVALQQQVNASILSAGRIVNPKTQQFVLNAINAVATVVLAMLALITSISSKTAVARMAQDSKIKLAQVEPYLDKVAATKIVAEHYKGNPDVPAYLSDGTFGAGSLAVSGAWVNLQQAGF
jgi:hypothetical protein